MAKKQKVNGVPFGAFAAVTVYADLLSLLLTLFVVLFAISEPKRPQLAATMAAARQIMSGQTTPAPPPRPPVRPQRTTPDELGVLRRGPPGKRSEVQSLVEDGRQKMVIGGEEFFTPGSSTLSPKAKQVIQTYIVPDMRGFDNRIELTGHADTAEAEGAGNIDPWVLGSARALAVMRFLVDDCGIEEKRFRLISSGDADPAPPDSASGNRRVEVVMTELRTP